MKTVAIACCLLLSGLPRTSQEQASTETGHFRNGRWWKAASFDMKIGYEIGFVERFSLDEEHIPSDSTFSNWFKGAPAFGEVVAALDKFYEEPANAVIPLPLAWDVIVTKFNGGSAADVQLATEVMRRASLKLKQ